VDYTLVVLIASVGSGHTRHYTTHMLRFFFFLFLSVGFGCRPRGVLPCARLMYRRALWLFSTACLAPLWVPVPHWRTDKGLYAGRHSPPHAPMPEHTCPVVDSASQQKLHTSHIKSSWSRLSCTRLGVREGKIDPMMRLLSI
jgi:hypothetical protein